ncbi:MAG: FAD-dependent oxidoreductase, partial [bacterium]
EKDEIFDLGREGGHSRRRIVHTKDRTGNEVEKNLLDRVEANKNITIYEKEPHVGGKVLSYSYGGHIYELGAVWAEDDHRLVHELADQYGIDFQPEESSMIVRDPDGNNYELGLEYLLNKYHPAEIQLALAHFTLIQSKFKSLNNIGFAGAEPELFVNFDTFMEKYGIEPLACAFRPFWVGAGYGYYDEVPALYVLKLMMPAMRALSPCLNIFHWAPDGFQKLWEKVAEDLGDVRLNHTVEKIRRYDLGSSVSIEVTANSLTETFDRIIISCDLKGALQFIDASEEEQELFSQVQNNNYHVHIVQARGIPYDDGTVVSFEKHHVPETIGHVTALLNREDVPGVWVSYQLAPWGVSSDEVMSLLDEDVRWLGGCVESIIIGKQWSYFPHVKTETLQAGFYERIEALQGKKGTYYIGGIMNFELVENTCQYAEKLVKTYFQD